MKSYRFLSRSDKTLTFKALSGFCSVTTVVFRKLWAQARGVLFALCALWFIFLCCFHYFSLRPLWVDENLILDNIKSFSPKELLGPLKKSQAFPRVYLIVIKFISEKFNYHPFSLRFFSIICMISAFFVWVRIYSKVFQGWGFLLAVFSFSSSYYMSYYASEFKPYSMDVLAVGLFCLYLMRQKQYVESGSSKTFIFVTLILPAAILFSYGSFFVFLLVVYNFLLLPAKSFKSVILLIGYVILSFSFIVFVFLFDLRYSFVDTELVSYWHDYFLCTQTVYCFFKSFGEGIRKLSVWWFGNSKFFREIASFFIPFVIVPMFGYGIRSLRKNRFILRDVDALGLAVFLNMFIFGLIKKYPFTGERITLFFAPFVFYFIVKGINFFREKRFLYISLNVFYFGFLLVCSVNSFFAYWKLYSR